MLRQAVPLLLLLAQNDEKGFKPLFNGKDFEGWKFFLGDKSADPAKTFSVKDGVIVCTGSPDGYMYTAKSYHDFTLRLEWRHERPVDLKDEEAIAGDGGYLLYITEHGLWPKCIEVEGMSGEPGKIQGRVLVSRYLTAEPSKALKPVGEWNALEIVAKAKTVAVRLNGTLVASADHSCKKGAIGFQSRGTAIHWRNIRIREE